LRRALDLHGGRRAVTTSIPPEVAQQAEEVVRFRPDPPEGLAIELVRDPRFHVLLGALPMLNVVDGLRLDEDGVERAVRDVRELLRSRDRDVAAWHVSSASTPKDLEARLLLLGLASSADPPFEPEWAAMATVTEPLGTVPAGVVARAIDGID
jgi:hypothetical protein